MTVFVDSGAHIALLDPDDQHRGNAVACLKTLKGLRLITSTFVLDEVGTRGSRLVGARAAANYVRGVLSSPIYHVIEVTREHMQEALRALTKYEDPGFSLTDCTSVLLVRGGRIPRVFTFDRAFRRIGLTCIP